MFWIYGPKLMIFILLPNNSPDFLRAGEQLLQQNADQKLSLIHIRRNRVGHLSQPASRCVRTGNSISGSLEFQLWLSDSVGQKIKQAPVDIPVPPECAVFVAFDFRN